MTKVRSPCFVASVITNPISWADIMIVEKRARMQRRAREARIDLSFQCYFCKVAKNDLGPVRSCEVLMEANAQVPSAAVLSRLMARRSLQRVGQGKAGAPSSSAFSKKNGP